MVNITKDKMISIISTVGLILVLWLILDEVLGKVFTTVLIVLIALFCVFFVIKSIPRIKEMIKYWQIQIWGKPLDPELWTDAERKDMKLLGGLADGFKYKKQNKTDADNKNTTKENL